MFGDVPILPSWYYGGQITGGVTGEAVETITTDTTAARSRNAQELAYRVERANNKTLVVGPQSSELIIALNNTLRFSATKRADGNYEITDRLNATNLLLIAIPATLLLVLFLKK